MPVADPVGARRRPSPRARAAEAGQVEPEIVPARRIERRDDRVVGLSEAGRVGQHQEPAREQRVRQLAQSRRQPLRVLRVAGLRRPRDRRHRLAAAIAQVDGHPFVLVGAVRRLCRAGDRLCRRRQRLAGRRAGFERLRRAHQRVRGRDVGTRRLAQQVAETERLGAGEADAISRAFPLENGAAIPDRAREQCQQFRVARVLRGLHRLGDRRCRRAIPLRPAECRSPTRRPCRRTRRARPG